MIYQDKDEFIEWYKGLQPDEDIDLHEAMIIFFNQETYEEVI